MRVYLPMAPNWNRRRAKKGRAAVRAVVGGRGRFYREDFIDAIADILHAAEAAGQPEVQQMAETAVAHFKVETGKVSPWPKM